VALGGGGAKGLAHIAMLDVLDEFELEVHMISGTSIGAIIVSEKTILVEKMKARPPTIYIEPAIEDVRVLEFHKAEEIYAQARPARDELRRALAEALR
jgi:predicted acylesterase/phospholipase RssA